MKDKRLKSALGRSKLEILFAYLYPRLDVEVSKKMNHLLKAPFCVHPKTGKVCVPIDPAAAWDFDIDTVPTVSQLLQEVDDAAAPGAKVRGPRWRRLLVGHMLGLYPWGRVACIRCAAISMVPHV